MTESKRRIVIIGGGFGGLFTALDLAGGGEITLINEEDHFLFKPMLYEYLSGEVQAWHIAPDCRELLDNQTKFIRGRVTNIDPNGQTVSLADHKELSYDVLIFSPGAITNYAGVEGAEKFSLPFRTLDDANHLRRRMTEALDHVQPELEAPGNLRESSTAP